ncbi:hypothetical protein CPB84DRAFT_1671941 [Gymnopilus junonius]|uniref:rRNA-processing protein EFG1 n=1 Tax=Gymnopilus junonius TaxID=109634 RepID=A0A9P5TTN4_GYMJU|nr:hypothetical protein CPB84DRAFT_1671941 [Gymnopilus junonius]
MPPSRTRDNQKNGEASTSKVESKPRRHRHRSAPEQTTTAPGVQKVKAALRQTRRLLAQDNLAADVRVETERRLKGLEVELQQAETSKKERAFAVRYHKVKFFERQKVTRKLTRAKKALESTVDASEKKKLSTELHDLRVDLNYIQHYPKTKKYISLFPPEVRKGEKVSVASQADTERTNKEREELRKWIREQMEQGDLPGEPELELPSTHGKSRAQKWPQQGTSAPAKAEAKKLDDVQEDDFFGEDDEDKDEESS